MLEPEEMLGRLAGGEDSCAYRNVEDLLRMVMDEKLLWDEASSAMNQMFSGKRNGIFDGRHLEHIKVLLERAEKNRTNDTGEQPKCLLVMAQCPRYNFHSLDPHEEGPVGYQVTHRYLKAISLATRALGEGATVPLFYNVLPFCNTRACTPPPLPPTGAAPSPVGLGPAAGPPPGPGPPPPPPPGPQGDVDILGGDIDEEGLAEGPMEEDQEPEGEDVDWGLDDARWRVEKLMAELQQLEERGFSRAATPELQPLSRPAVLTGLLRVREEVLRNEDIKVVGKIVLEHAASRYTGVPSNVGRTTTSTRTIYAERYPGLGRYLARREQFYRDLELWTDRALVAMVERGRG
ncbi:hypothetical protein CF326_g3758 [Tilletia indica]|nr:hypothetical protein CF326_g3758 [Tilletia indica]